MFPKLTAGVQALDGLLGEVAKNAANHADSIRKSVAEAETAVRKAETQISEDLDRTRDRAKETSEEITSLVDQLLSRTADQFDDLAHRLQDATGPFNEEIQLLLAKVELGAASVNELIRKFGDAKVGGERLRDLLQGVDFNRFRNDIQALIQDLQRGALKIDDLLKFLNSRGGDFGKTVAGWIDAFKKGEISLQRLKDLINGAEQEFAGTDFAEFLDEIEDAIDTGRLK